MTPSMPNSNSMVNEEQFVEPLIIEEPWLIEWATLDIAKGNEKWEMY